MNHPFNESESAFSGGSTALSASADIEDAWATFFTFLKKTEARVTQARRIVFFRAMEVSDHFKADDLASQLASGEERVSRATVYHTLALMVKAGFLRTLRDSERHVQYERAWGRAGHDHMICEQCGAIIEFRAPEMAEAIRRRCAEHCFHERAWRISVMGLCPKCFG